MTTIADFLESLGSQALEAFWLPLLAWTVFWLVMEGILRLKPDLHPTMHYRAYQAILMCLPVGFAIATIAAASTMFAKAPVLITFEMPITVSAVAPDLRADLMTDAGIQFTLPLVLGAATVLAVLAATLQLARLAINSMALHRYRRSITSAEATSRRMDAMVGRTAITIIVTDEASVPMTFGLRRPVVVIPSSLDGQDRRLALAHEMIHVRQRDTPAQWLESIVAAVFAIHPAVHVLRRRCDLFREMACDAALLRDSDINRRSYADLLFRLVRPPSTLHSVSVSMADSKPHLHKRLHAMKAYHSFSRSDPNPIAWTLALCVLLFGAVTLVVPQAFAQRGDAPPPPPEAVSSPDSPYVILDGVPFDGSIKDLNPALIRDIEVLKGAPAIERFGEHARHGALVVTTGEGPPAPPAPPHPWSDTTAAYVVVESMPELIGGLESIQQQLRYAEEALEAGVEGRVFVHFVVDEEGNVVDAEVTRGLGHGLDEEALRVVQTARFKPGTQHGEPVRVMMALPISFRIGEDAPSVETSSDRRDGVQILQLRVRPDGERGSITLRGNVVDPQTGGPLVGASVTTEIDGRAIGAATDNEGEFVLHVEDVDRPTARSYDLEVTHPALNGPRSIRINDGDRAVSAELPTQFSVTGVYPNPFNRTATLTFDLPDRGTVGVEIFDMTGRRVLTVPEREFAAGAHQAISFDGSSLASGSYVYRITAEVDGRAQTETGSLTLVK